MTRSEILTSIVNDFATATAIWYDALLPIAVGLFWLLAAIEISWSATWWTLEREDPTAMIAAFLRKIASLMFFYTLLIYFRDWSFLVLDSFAEAGRRASGLTKLDPSVVLDQGSALCGEYLRRVFDAGLLGAANGGFVIGASGLIIFLAFVLIAVQMSLTIVEAYFVLGAGVFMLGFAGSRFTAPFASRFLSFSFGIGVKLFTIHLIVGVGVRLAEGWRPLVARSGIDVEAMLQILGASILYAFLAWSIPNLAGSIMNGAVSLTLTDGARALGASGRAGAGATRAAATVAAPVLNVLARVRNAVSPDLSGRGDRGRGTRASGFRRDGNVTTRARGSDGRAHPPREAGESGSNRERSAANRES